MSVYGIESQADCRAVIDELLEMVVAAKHTMNAKTVGDLKDALKKYYQQRDPARQSDVESRWFVPAISEAYVLAPNIGRPKTWRTGLDDVEHKLRSNRPEDKDAD